MKPLTLRYQRKHMLLERIARLELQGYSDTEIALFVNRQRQYVSVLRMKPEFVAIRMSLASGVLQSLDNDLDENILAAK